ncbi:polyprenyl synthetase family protein [Streptomyces sp. NPDC050732]|uniref:polyprenyl synthetase family protein n=1 Tax=Streptomyces sp. NPDC050732 TaxID=3154632 RepID=UPI003442B7F9
METPVPPPSVSPASSPAPAEAALTRTLPYVHQYLAELLNAYPPQQSNLKDSLSRLITHGRSDPQESALPFLVHAAMTGDLAPAVPVAAAHALWWRAANTFDDFVDGDAGSHLYGLSRGAALTAALECGYALPLRALATVDAPEHIRDDLTRTYLEAWTVATNGQLGDLLNKPEQITPRDVLAVYRDKSGATYAMACSMAARLATRAAPPTAGATEHIAQWHRFGQVLGVLAQLRNDEDDLRDGPGEDLRNRTPTYRLVHLLHSLSGRSRQQALALLREAPSSEAVRKQLRTLMSTPEVLRRYHAQVAALREEAHALLDHLAPTSSFGSALRTRVEAETHFLPTGTPNGSARACAPTCRLCRSPC